MEGFAEITLSVINDGTSPAFVSIGNESQNIPCTNDGLVLDQILIEIPFGGYIGTERCECIASIGVLPGGMTLGQNNASTVTDDGKIIFNIEENATLGNVQYGTIPITFTLNNTTIIKNFTWTKTNEGESGRVYKLSPSSMIIKKGADNTLLPSSITFKSTVMIKGEPTDYNGYFIISESTDGTTYNNKYLSSKIENEVLYSPSSIDVKIIKCILSNANDFTSILDTQSVIVLTDVDNIEPTLSEIRKDISGVSEKVDAVNKSIKDEVWRNSIITIVDKDGNEIKKTLENLLVEHNVDLNGISTKVEKVTSDFENEKESVSKQFSEAKQNFDRFKQTVSDTYETKDGAEKKYSEFEQDASGFKQTVKDELNGYKAELSETAKKLRSQIESTDGNVSKLEQDVLGFKTEVSKTYMTKDGLNDIQIGGTNLIRNSNDLIFSLYYFVADIIDENGNTLIDETGNTLVAYY